MIANNKSKTQIEKDLEDFLGENVGVFCDWYDYSPQVRHLVNFLRLWKTLQDYVAGKDIFSHDQKESDVKVTDLDKEKERPKLSSEVVKPDSRASQNQARIRGRPDQSRENRHGREREREEREERDRREKNDRNRSGMEEDTDKDKNKKIEGKRGEGDRNSGRLILSAVQQAVQSTSENTQKKRRRDDENRETQTRRNERVRGNDNRDWERDRHREERFVRDERPPLIAHKPLPLPQHGLIQLPGHINGNSRFPGQMQFNASNSPYPLGRFLQSPQANVNANIHQISALLPGKPFAAHVNPQFAGITGLPLGSLRGNQRQHGEESRAGRDTTRSFTNDGRGRGRGRGRSGKGNSESEESAGRVMTPVASSNRLEDKDKKVKERMQTEETNPFSVDLDELEGEEENGMEDRVQSGDAKRIKTSTQPADVAKSKVKCQFWPKFTKGTACEFAHPNTQCM
eukprot:TRINITY_DN3880_c0_g1_i3.p1 TRINITY_DN3880_c0_g1~~TRINITY_DN3880_c0_g1_i3.p1  ORF type:complete len:515 (+),score=134.24 TRINITY_DN3880_c0_g1_i3:176-1546(+)